MFRVKKGVLILFSGVIWTLVGLLLIWISVQWLTTFSSLKITGLLIAGIAFGYVISRFGFSLIANKNINRILDYDGKACPFAFQKWQSYILILFMIFLGIFLRKTHVVSDTILTIIYLSIGFALFISAFRYYASIFKKGKQ